LTSKKDSILLVCPAAQPSVTGQQQHKKKGKKDSATKTSLTSPKAAISRNITFFLFRIISSFLGLFTF